MSSLGGIGVLIGVGVLAYVLLQKLPSVNLPIENKLIQEDNKIKVQGNLTPTLLTELQKSIPNLSGSQVTSLIHGGSIQTGYLGTNGKWYKDIIDAARNGAAPFTFTRRYEY